MKLLLDSADLDEIRLIAQSDAISGVTTNPSLISKLPRNGDGWQAYLSHIKEVGAIVKWPKHLSVEVISLDPAVMRLQAQDIADTLPAHTFVKIPVCLETLSLITRLVDAGFNVNATGCMAAQQARMASDAGAQVVSFFFGRMCDYYATQMWRDSQRGGTQKALEELSLYDSFRKLGHASARVICGSIRSVEAANMCWAQGADYVTTNIGVIRDMVDHPKTKESIEGFQRDIEKWLA